MAVRSIRPWCRSGRGCQWDHVLPRCMPHVPMVQLVTPLNQCAAHIEAGEVGQVAHDSYVGQDGVPYIQLLLVLQAAEQPAVVDARVRDDMSTMGPF